MTLASSMILVDQTAVPLASPDALQDLGATASQGQWLMTANILPLAALMVFGGRLGDLFGLRRVFLWGAVIFALATTAMGAAQDMEWAIAARALQGGGAALMMPTALAIVSAVYPATRRRARRWGSSPAPPPSSPRSARCSGGLLTSSTGGSSSSSTCRWRCSRSS